MDGHHYCENVPPTECNTSELLFEICEMSSGVVQLFQRAIELIFNGPFGAISE